jgi:hypothetical protein
MKSCDVKAAKPVKAPVALVPLLLFELLDDVGEIVLMGESFLRP